MKIYLTQDDKKTIRKNYPRLINEEMFVIDTLEIVRNLYNKDEIKLDKLNLYLINQVINHNLHSAYNSKRYRNVLYIVDYIDRQFIYSFKKYLKEQHIFVTDFILVDYEQILDSKIYKFFDNVI
jgi:hypothetical protein